MGIINLVRWLSRAGRWILDSLASPLRRVAAVLLLAALCAVVALFRGEHWTGVILLILTLGAAAVLYATLVRPALIPRGSTLWIRLHGPLPEQAPHLPLGWLLGHAPTALFDVRRALVAARNDDRLRAVVVELGGTDAGLGTAEELHELLAAIGAAGKRTVALLVGDAVTVRDYLVACAAKEVVINPDATLMMLGSAAGSLFLKGAFDKAGVEAQTIQWKQYKGAAEMFSREAMSPALRESLEALVEQWRSVVADHAGKARKLAVESARQLLGAGFLSARAACESGLVDRQGYGEDFRAELDGDQWERRLIDLRRYLWRRRYLAMMGGRRARLGVIFGVGPVLASDAPGGGEFMSGESTAAAIRRAASDPSVRAIVFRVNSPGGSAVGSELIWRAVADARQRGKPVVVSMGDVAGSGGYYVAAGADAIVAEPATVTGSIGVFYVKFNLGKLMARLGVRLESVKSDPISDALSPVRPLDSSELQQLDGVMAELYANFTARVSEGRKLSPERAEAAAQGRLWSGQAAMDLGLIDEFGGFERAIELARAKAGIAPDQPHELAVYMPQPLIYGLRSLLWPAASPGTELARLVAGVPETWTQALLVLLKQGGPTLLCPFLAGW